MSLAHLERFADPQARDAGLRQAAGGSTPALAGRRRVFYLGSGAGRDRVWLQCDAAGDGQALAAAAATIIASLTGDAPNRYKPLLLGRARIAVVPPGPLGDAPALPVPQALDGGLLGAAAPLLRLMDDFAPTLVVHLQDWAGTAQAGQGDRVNPGAAEAPGAQPVGLARGLAGAGLRLVESFHLAPDLHRRLGAVGEGGEGLRNWLGRPSALARELAAHPDARPGASARRHVVRQGYRVFEPSAEAAAARDDPSWPAVIRLAPGRYVPRLEWRRLGGASLGEIALARYGALAFCGQSFDNPVAERAGAAVALAEAAVISRLAMGIEAGGAAA